MGRSSSELGFEPEEFGQRLRKTLKAAFSMKPTPLKSIPKKRGKARPSRTSRKSK